MSNTTERWTRHLALASYGALLVLVIAWETWAAPPTPLPRGFWLIVKVLPLLAPLPGLWRNSSRAYVLSALLVLLYFCEGVSVTYSAVKTGNAAALIYGTAETLLSVIYIGAASFCARFILRRPTLASRAETES